MASKVGYCAVVGLPNAGKSTLVNRLVGSRLLAVSGRPQTTRHRILGVLNQNVDGDAVQMIFVDTPGMQTGKGALRGFMTEQSLAAVGDADCVLFVVDLADSRQRGLERFEKDDVRKLWERVKEHKNVLVLLNKTDVVKDKSELLQLMAQLGEAGFADVIPVSAQKDKQFNSIFKWIGSHLPEGEKLFPEDTLTDRNDRFVATELIREQLFRRLGQEVPYSTTVQIEQFQDRGDDIVIHALVLVERESQKGIVVGAKGRTIQEVGTRARAVLTKVLQCPVHLMLHVKVAEGWTRDEKSIEKLGYTGG